jgi:hypothetical protein
VAIDVEVHGHADQHGPVHEGHAAPEDHRQGDVQHDARHPAPYVPWPLRHL